MATQLRIFIRVHMILEREKQWLCKLRREDAKITFALSPRLYRVFSQFRVPPNPRVLFLLWFWSCFDRRKHQNAIGFIPQYQYILYCPYARLVHVDDHRFAI